MFTIRQQLIRSGRLFGARSFQSVSVGSVNRESSQSIRHSQSIATNETIQVKPIPQNIILTGRASPSKRAVAPPLDAAGRLNASIKTLLQPGFQSNNQEWLSVICELSKLKQYERISSLWKQWMTTLPSAAAIKQMSTSEKNMFLPNESIFAMLLKCPAGLVTASEAVQYLDTWQMELTGQIHRMMVTRQTQAGDLSSASNWLSDLYKRNLRSSPAIETSLFRHLVEEDLMTESNYDLVVQAWDRSMNSSSSLDANWCVAVLAALVRFNDVPRCSQMAQKLLSNRIGTYSFSAPELFGPLVDVLTACGSNVQAAELTRHWNSTVPSFDMNTVAATKQQVRSLLESDKIDACVNLVLTQNAFGQLLRSSYALVLHVLHKKHRVTDMQKVWNSWLTTIPSLQTIQSMTAAERNCSLPQEIDLAFLLSVEPCFVHPDDLLSLAVALDVRPTAVLHSAILSHKVRCGDISGVVSSYLQVVESSVVPNEQIVDAVVTAVRQHLAAETRPVHLHGIVVSVWEFCMSSSSPMTSEWADVFLSVFEHYGDVERAMQLIECILSVKLSDATPKLVGSFITRANVMLLKKGRKPLPSTLATMRVVDTRDRRAIDS